MGLYSPRVSLALRLFLSAPTLRVHPAPEMVTRDLLLLIGFLRSGKMYPTAVPFNNLPVQRSLKLVQEGMAEQERALFGKFPRQRDREDLKRRSALTSWSGAPLPLGTRIAEVADPGVVLCLVYDEPCADAALPVDVFAQTLRRYALRDASLRAKFEQHVDNAGTYIPAWLSPETRRQKSQEAFDAAMKLAREHGFAHAAPFFEGVRGDSFPQAQIAIAVHEMRELGDITNALRRLNEVVRVAPRNIAARMQRARILIKDPGRKVEAATDFLMVLRELARLDTLDTSQEVRDAATNGLWTLHREFTNPKQLEAAVTLAKQDPKRGLEALSRYVHTHPCSWDAQVHLATLALAQERFDLTVKLLAYVRWIFPEDPNPHFAYGQALTSKGLHEGGIRALEYAAKLSSNDPEIERRLRSAYKELDRNLTSDHPMSSIRVAHHVARSLLVILGFLRHRHVYPTAMMLRRLPGDVSLAVVLQAIAAQERRRFPREGYGPEAQLDLRGVNERATLTDYAGEPLSPDMTVGDVADPGIIVAILNESAGSGDVEHPVFELTSETCRTTLLHIVREDSELHGKLTRHLKSAEATLKARLGM